MPPPFTVAASLPPSADDDTEVQAAVPPLGKPDVCWVHELPELVEVQMPPPFTTATNLVPSADDATADQAALEGKPLPLPRCVHELPELTEV